MSATSATTLFTLAGNITINIEDAIADIDKVITKVDDLYTKLQNTSWGGFVNEIATLDTGISNAFESLDNLQTGVGETGLVIGELETALSNVANEANATAEKIGGDGSNTFKNIMINVVSSLLYDLLVLLKDVAVEFFKMGITFNSTTETLVASFKNFSSLDTSKAEALVEKLRDFAKNTPYDVNTAATAAYKLLDAGFGDDEVIDQLYMLGEMAGNNNTKLEEIAGIYANVVGYGKMRDTDMEAFAKQGIFVEELLGGYLGDETILANSLINTFKRATSEGGQYYGNMAEAMATWVGQSEKLNEQLNETAGIVTKPFFEQLRDFVMPVLSVQLKDFGDFYGTLDGGMDGLAEIIGTLIIIVVECFLQVSKYLTGLLAIVGYIWNGLEWFLNEVASFIGHDRKDPVLEIVKAYMPGNPDLLSFEDAVKKVNESQKEGSSPWESHDDEDGPVVIPYMGPGVNYDAIFNQMRTTMPTTPNATFAPNRIDGLGGSLVRTTDITALESTMARIEAVLIDINSKTGRNQTVVLDTGTLVGAIAPKMDARLGLLGGLKARGNV